MHSGLKRGAQAFAPIGLAMALMSACTFGGQSAGGAAPTGPPKAGGAVAIAVGDGDLGNLNTQLTTDTDPLILADLWADGLESQAPDGSFKPHLATSWNVSEARTRYTFHLRSGVEWSDGRPFTSADVVSTWKVFSGLNSALAGLQPIVQSVTAPDAKTVVFQLRQPYTPFLKLMDKETFPLMPAHVYGTGSAATNPANLKPVGLGPFMLASWSEGRQMTFVRNPHYWDNPRPYLDKVVVALIPDAQQQVNALLSHEVDWAQVPIQQVASLTAQAKASGLRIYVPDPPAAERMVLTPNIARKGPLALSAVRQALMVGTDREQLVQFGYEGQAEPAASALPATLRGLYNPSVNYNKMFAYDPQRAGQMLTAAGYPLKNGKRFDITLTYATGLDATYPFEATARLIAAQWAKLGVDVNLDGEPATLMANKVYSQRDFDIMLMSLTSRNDPSFGIDRDFLCNTTRNAFTNPSGYCNPTLDKLINQVNAAPENERQGLYGEYEAIVARDMPELTLVTTYGTTYAVSTSLGGYRQQTSESYNSHPDWAVAWVG